MIEMHEAGTAAVSELSLGRCPALSGLPESVVRYLEERSQRKDMPAGKVIISADDPAHDVYVILKGAVGVFRKPPVRHHNVMLGRLGVGEIFGEFSAIDGERGSGTVQAIEDSVVMQIPFDLFRAILETNPGLARNIMGQITRHIRALNERLVKDEDFIQTLGEEFKELCIRSI